MSDTAAISWNAEGPIGYLQLNRPDRFNALDAEMVDALLAACREIERSTGLRAIILSGRGKAFCSGGDIDAWSSLDTAEFSRRWVRDGHDAFDALARLRLPVIAVLNGHALGGGLELAACADYRIAEAQIKLGQPETGLGVIPGWSGTQRATRRFGAQTVRRMVLFGEVFDAQEAFRLGLVDRVAPQGQGLAEAQKLAEVLCVRSPRATEIAKMMINAAEGEERERVLDALAGAAAFASPDLAEGTQAFRDKRPPDFKADDET